MRPRMVLIAAVLGAFSIAPASASAGAVSYDPPQPVGSFSVPLPLREALDPVDQDTLYVLPDNPPPRVLLYHVFKDGSTEPDGQIDLPDDVVPIDLWWDMDGLLHIETREGRSFEYCPDCDALRELEPRSSSIEFLVDGAGGYRTNLLTDFGSGDAGSLWWGMDLDSELMLRSGEHPSQVAFGGYGKIQKKSIVSGFFAFDEGQPQVLPFSDDEPPVEGDPIPGPAGVTHLSGIAISPLNLTPSFGGFGTMPMFVSDPGTGPDTGNIYYSSNWWASPSTPNWKPVSPTPLSGTPTFLDAGCKFLISGDYSRDRVSIYKLDRPKPSECDIGAEVKFRPNAPIQDGQLILSSVVKPYSNLAGRLQAGLGIPADRRVASRAAKQVKASSKVKLKGGRVKTAKLEFSRGATDAIVEAASSGRRLKGNATLKLKDKGGHRVKVKVPIGLKAQKAGRLFAKSG